MAGTQKAGVRQACTQYDTICADIRACCVRRLHTTARNCTRLLSTSLSPSVNTIWVCSPVLETKFFPWLEPAVEAICLWQTFVSSQKRSSELLCLYIANIPRVSPRLVTQRFHFRPRMARRLRFWNKHQKIKLLFTQLARYNRMHERVFKYQKTTPKKIGYQIKFIQI